ncbi:MAG: cell division protein ZapA [Cyclobacteriaceae bacterium]
MDELSIKIKIADREYPMKVRPADEERVRKAGKSINERLRSYRERFGIDDKQDLLSMVAFDCLIEKMEAEEKSYGADESVLEKISDLNTKISQAL